MSPLPAGQELDYYEVNGSQFSCDIHTARYIFILLAVKKRPVDNSEDRIQKKANNLNNAENFGLIPAFFYSVKEI